MRWVAVLLLCLIAGVAVAGWWWQQGEPEAPSAPSAPDTPSEPSEEPPAPVTEDGTPPVADVEAPVGAEPATDDAAAERSDAAPEAPTAGGTIVRVVRGPLGDPVADAVVFHLTQEAGEARAGGRGLDTVSWPEEWGQRARTDATGTVALPPSRAPWLVAARSGDEFGFARVPPGPRTVTLALLPDETLVVAAQHPDFRPAAGVPIVVFQQLADDDPRQIWTGTTGPDGQVRVAHFQLVRQKLQDPGAPTPKPERFAAVAAAACTPPAVVGFPGRPAPRDPVLLFVPPLGSIEVLLTDHSGVPLLSPAAVVAMPDAPPQIAGPVKLPPSTLHQRVTKDVGDAPVVLPRLGLGAPLRVFARFEGIRGPGAAIAVPGPDQESPLAQRTLPLAPHQLVVAGRLRTADGTPIGGASLPASLWRGGRDVARPTIHTVADGRFDFVLTARPEHERHELEVRHAVAATEGRPAHELGVRIALPSLAGGRRIDLGDVVLAELAALVDGAVVDDLGAPVADADVRVQQEVPVDANARGQQREPWRDLPHLQTRTRADGTFALWGARPEGSLRVRADTDAHFANSVPLYAAGRSVRLEILRNGVLRGTVLLPEWIAEGTVSLTVQPSGGDGQGRRVDLSRRGRGRFRVEPLRPGRHDAIVTLRNQKEPLAVVQDVFVQPGDVRDVRLDPLDLRQALFRYRLRAVDARGTPVAIDGPILLRTQTLQGTVAEAGFRWRHGRAEVIATAAVGDFQFFGRGVQPTRLSLAPGDHDVFLPTLRPALLELPGARALCGPARRVRVSAILTEATGLPESLQGVDQRSGEQFSFPRWDLGKSSGGWLGATDLVEVPLMKSGKYEVILRAHATDSERSPQQSLALGTFDLVADGVQPRPVVVPIDAAALQKMLAELDARQAAAAANRRR